ncbi:MAG TPA: regulatory protein RecX [Bacteroidales bacterium]|jgi:regulatory protein|nr:regulatory protein RecX [Bacteroidales bacterium]
MNENDLFTTALNKAMALCAGREYCTDDISGKLGSWGIKGDDAGKILEILVKEKFIDDRRYAEAFVKDKYRQNKWGRLKIASILKMKNIHGDIINLALQAIDEDEYRQTVREIVLSHRKSIKAKNDYDLKGKLMRFGLSRGFESNLLYDLINEID